jgi:hypothetical protein
MIYHVCEGSILRRPVSYCTHGAAFRLIVFLAPRMFVAVRVWAFWRWRGMGWRNWLKHAMRFRFQWWSELDEIRSRYVQHGLPWYE